jgi:hypothetical protein
VEVEHAGEEGRGQAGRRIKRWSRTARSNSTEEENKKKVKEEDDEDEEGTKEEGAGKTLGAVSKAKGERHPSHLRLYSVVSDGRLAG